MYSMKVFREVSKGYLCVVHSDSVFNFMEVAHFK